MLAVGKVPSMNVDGARHVATLSYVQFEGPCEKTILLNSSKGPKRVFWQSAVVVHETFSQLHLSPSWRNPEAPLTKGQGFGAQSQQSPNVQLPESPGTQLYRKKPH